jgi:hypothetical protein
MLSNLRKWIVLNKTSLIFYPIVVVVIGLLVWYIFDRPPVNTNPRDINIIPEVEQIKDVNGKTSALIHQYNTERAANKVLIDSLAHALSIKAEEIKGVDKYITKIDTLWKDSIVYIPATADVDSTIISRRDPYVSILAVGKKDSSYILFKLTEDTSTRIAVDHTPFLKRPYTDVYLRHSNPYFNTVRGNSFTIDQKVPLFSLGLSLGYDVINNRVSFGPTITKPIKTFYRKR